MAAKKAKRGRKARKPEGVIAPAVGTTTLTNILEAGKLRIDKRKFKAFMNQLKREGITSPKVRFVARNAPFMRRAPVLPI